MGPRVLHKCRYVALRGWGEIPNWGQTHPLEERLATEPFRVSCPELRSSASSGVIHQGFPATNQLPRLSAVSPELPRQSPISPDKCGTEDDSASDLCCVKRIRIRP